MVQSFNSENLIFIQVSFKQDLTNPYFFGFIFNILKQLFFNQPQFFSWKTFPTFNVKQRLDNLFWFITKYKKDKTYTITDLQGTKNVSS